MTPERHSAGLFVLLVLGGCTGQMDSPLRPLVTAVEAGGAEPEAPVVCSPSLPVLQNRIVRLDSHSYKTTVQAIFNSYRGQLDRWPIDPPLPFTRFNSGDPFTTFAASYSVNEYDFEELLVAARVAAEAYPAFVVSRGGCFKTTPGLPACQREVISELTTKLFNRPASELEFDEALTSLAEHQAAGATPVKAMELVARAFLLSPRLLFRDEIGTAEKGLNSYQRAQLISFGLTGRSPDAALWALAGKDELQTEAVLRSEIRRLMAKPESLSSLRRFFREYFRWGQVLEVSKDPKATFHQPAALVQDIELTVERHISLHARAGLLRAVLLSDEVHVSPATAKSWQVAENSNGFMTLAGRPGLMTQPAWLAGFSEGEHNRLVGRGRFVRERLLCTVVPPLPGGIFPNIPDQPGLTLRARIEQQTSGQSCAGCHRLMNGLGAAFEGFDHFGRPQTTDNGAAVDTSSTVAGLGGREVAVANPTDLMKTLSEAPEVHDCYLANLFAFYVGRTATREDQCEITRLRTVYRESGEDTLAAIEELLVWQATNARAEVTP